MVEETCEKQKLSYPVVELQSNAMDFAINQELVSFENNNRVIQTIFQMSYEDYVYFLIRKYGMVKYPYFKEVYSGKIDSRNARIENCLYIHHIDEDKAAFLSSDKGHRSAFGEYQLPWRLVYCNVVEHMILHMKIVEKELSRARVERKNRKMLGFGGFVLLATSINCMLDFKYNGRSIPADYDGIRERKFAEECNSFWVNFFCGLSSILWIK